MKFGYYTAFVFAILLVAGVGVEAQEPITTLERPAMTLASEIPSVVAYLSASRTETATGVPENIVEPETNDSKTPSLGLTLGAGLLAAYALDPSLAEGGSSGGNDIARAISNAGGAPLIVGTALARLFGKGGTRRAYGMALEAVGDAATLTGSLKYLTGRKRPDQADSSRDFDGPVSGFESFPSGHTSAGFAVATVLAKEKPKRKWLYYGLATAIGWSRMAQNDHWFSDVFAGATIGVYSGRKAVRGRTLVGKLGMDRLVR